MADQPTPKPRQFIQGKARRIILSAGDGGVRETRIDTVIVGTAKPALPRRDDEAQHPHSDSSRPSSTGG